MGCSRIHGQLESAFPSERHSDSTLYKARASHAVCVQGALDNLEPFKIFHLFNPEESLHTTFYRIPFSKLVNDRHITRYHLGK